MRRLVVGRKNRVTERKENEKERERGRKRYRYVNIYNERVRERLNIVFCHFALGDFV